MPGYYNCPACYSQKIDKFRKLVTLAGRRFTRVICKCLYCGHNWHYDDR